MATLCIYVTMITYWVVFIAMTNVSEASVGDRSYVFQKCANKCKDYNCTGDRLGKFSAAQPLTHSVLQWSCMDECRYMCMWITVDAFQRDGSPIPQFNGKWPFVRVWGIQEPASMIFSALNGLAHFSILRYRKYVSSSTPMYYVWHGGSIIAMNAWTWSTIFHSKDTDFTEKMDYFCAFSIVLYSTFAFFCRLFGFVKWWRPLGVAICCIVFYIRHVWFLAFDRFDYGYNMKVNIGVALFNMVGWLAWCIWKRKRRYVFKAVASIIGVQLLLSLELGDFPPLWWTFDAHALWHAGTAPLALLWYSFIIDDGQYMMTHKDSDLLPQKLD